jgi:hypothetical protein
MIGFYDDIRRGCRQAQKALPPGTAVLIGKTSASSTFKLLYRSTIDLSSEPTKSNNVDRRCSIFLRRKSHSCGDCTSQIDREN